MSVVVIPESSIEDNTDYDGWYCLKFKSTVCRGCGRKVEYVHDDWRGWLVVWPEKDDDDLLELAQFLIEKRRELDPRIVEYERSMGPAIPYDKV